MTKSRFFNIFKRFFKKNIEDDNLSETLYLYGKGSGVIINIGANEGQWIRYAKSIFPQSPVIAFEPIPWLYEKLMGSFREFNDIHVLNKAVSDTLEPQLLNVTKVSGNSSFFKPSDLQKTSINHNEVTDIVRQIEVECTTIDSFLTKTGDRVKLLKVDAQGAEDKILKGAENSIKKGLIDLIYIEIMFAPIYDGQASWIDICTFLNEHGYWLHSFHGSNLQKDFSLTHSNALFISSALGRKNWG